MPLPVHVRQSTDLHEALGKKHTSMARTGEVGGGNPAVSGIWVSEARPTAGGRKAARRRRLMLRVDPAEL